MQDTDFLPAQALQNWAFGAVIAVAAISEMFQGVAQFGQMLNFLVKLGDMGESDLLDTMAWAALLPQAQKRVDLLHREAKITRTAHKAQAVNILLVLFAVAIGTSF